MRAVVLMIGDEDRKRLLSRCAGIVATFCCLDCVRDGLGFAVKCVSLCKAASEVRKSITN